jgi:signal transduction histidine kinase
VTADDTVIVSGLVDGQGRLVEADPRLIALQLSADGDDDGVLAIPQLATLARLSLNLQTVISRSVIVSEHDRTLTLWVRAVPETHASGQYARLSLSGWREEPPTLSHADRQKRAIDLGRLVRDGRWSCDSQLRMTSLTPLPEASAPIGVRLTSVFSLEHDETGDFALFNAMADGEDFATQIAAFRSDPDFPISLSGEPSLTEDGRFRGFTGQFRWVSRMPDWASVETADNRATYPLEERLDAALRSPLHRIIEHADTLAAASNAGLQDVYVGYAGDIAAAGRHLLGLVDDLADLQAVEREDFTIETNTIDLADVARRAARLLGVRAANAGVRIDVPDADENLLAMGDFKRLLQIMVNLIGNALRYSPKGAQIWVRTEREGDLAAVIVADQGKGVEPENHEMIFGKFGRVDHKEPGGTGLGLYISRRLARAMGGDICVDSAAGRGARFVLTLPAAALSFPD